jgi:hypothetical protein
MSNIRKTPRRTTRKPRPPPIEVTAEGVILPGNSGSTIGSPPRRDEDDRPPEDRAHKVLALDLVRHGLPGRAPERQPYMFINPNNMCYRNSALAMLLNIEPFLGWLNLHNQVSLAGRDGYPETIMSYLYKMVEAYWLSDDSSQRFLEIAIDDNIIPAFWTDVNVRWQWGKPHSQEDVSEFLGHLWTQARTEMVCGYVCFLVSFD